jgi:hypothetical protein
MRSGPVREPQVPSDLTAWLWVLAIGGIAVWLALSMLLER